MTCINVAITGGQFISCLIAGSLSRTQGGWRYMLGISSIPAVIQFIGFLSIPESPRWLVSKGRTEDAEAALRLMRKNDEDIVAELADLMSIDVDEDGKPRVTEVRA